MTKTVSILLSFVVIISTFAMISGMQVNAATYTKNIVVTIDPGHGASDYGATCKYKNEKYYEKNMTLAISKAIKKELETYKNVKVYLTRTGESNPSLADRAYKAFKNNSDLFFSVHINSKGDAQKYTDGASVLVSSGQYHKELAKSEWKLAGMVLDEINSSTGITRRGLLKRLYSGNKYPNGKTADYYGIIRRGTEYGIVTMLTEHAFISSSKDMKVLSNKNNLTKLGKADATAIAKYYGLSKKNGTVKYPRTGSYVKFTSRYWLQKDGKWYYVNANETFAKGWKTFGSYKYHFNKTGAADTDQKKISGNIYKFSNKGKMYVNKWSKTNGKMYYYGKNGKAYKSCKKRINGKKYVFDNDGVCVN